MLFPSPETATWLIAPLPHLARPVICEKLLEVIDSLGQGTLKPAGTGPGVKVGSCVGVGEGTLVEVGGFRVGWAGVLAAVCPA